MCASVAGLVLKVLSDLLGHENHEVLSHESLGRAGRGQLPHSPSASICISYFRAFIISEF